MDSGPNTTGPNSPDSNKLTFDGQNPPKPKKHVRLPPPAQPETESRYWNEFDDGSEFGDDTSYAIYVNPEEPSDFPGSEIASKIFLVLYEGLGDLKGYIISWLPLPSRESREGERQPLLSSQRVAQELEDSSESDGDGNARAKDKSRRRSSALLTGVSIKPTTAPRRRKVYDPREILIFRIYVAAFLLSYVVLVLSATLLATGRRKDRVEVDTGVIIGVTIALFCSIGGVALVKTRRDHLSWLHRVAVGLAFCIACTGSGYVLALVGNIQ